MAIDWVVDASAAVKLATAEADSETFRGLVEGVAGRLLAPSLLRYEVGNALAGKGTLASDEMLLAALAFVERIEPHDVAPYCKPLSYYDAAYLALAVEHKAGLLTADDRMRKAAKRHGVPVAP